MLLKNIHILPDSGVFSHVGLNPLLKVIIQLHLILCHLNMCTIFRTSLSLFWKKRLKVPWEVPFTQIVIRRTCGILDRNALNLSLCVETTNFTRGRIRSLFFLRVILVVSPEVFLLPLSHSHGRSRHCIPCQTVSRTICASHYHNLVLFYTPPAWEQPLGHTR